MGSPSPWPWVLAAAAVALGVLGTVLDVLAGSHGEPAWTWALGALVTLASTGVGLLVTRRRPGHPIGWLLIANAFLLATFGVAEPYAAYALQEQPGHLPLDCFNAERELVRACWQKWLVEPCVTKQV